LIFVAVVRDSPRPPDRRSSALIERRYKIDRRYSSLTHYLGFDPLDIDIAND
jgi:hypothetical protein